MIDLDPRWDHNKLRDERELLNQLIQQADLTPSERADIVQRAARLVERIRGEVDPGLMEVFLSEYGLSTDEGVALMCLAEALLRVPDEDTIDALIEDKIAASDWSRHIGHSSSPLVNASTWGLMLTGKVLDETGSGIVGTLRSLVKRMGEPVVRTAVGHAMREMGRQFVLGESIQGAMKRAREKESDGFTYSYDMLGEAAMTAADARRYQQAYASAIAAISSACEHDDIAANPGISVKLSALHPRYEVAKTARVMRELVPLLTVLARQAAAAGMGLNVDAEEADRLGLSLRVIEEVLADPELAGWNGFGVVVQAYGRRAGDVIDGLYEIAQRLDRRIMVRLVKGAYWDTEIKRAQVDGLEDFPVFTRKEATDVSYLANARKLLGMTDRIYPQFATHNAHSVVAILAMAGGVDKSRYEFQRLHGMGEALHDIVQREEGTRCRIYAPVGAHRDLLAYLVRRLLENGANSSFVNQIVDEDVPPEVVVACPLTAVASFDDDIRGAIVTGPEVFKPSRANSRGFDLTDVTVLTRIDDARTLPEYWRAGPILAVDATGGEELSAYNPATGALIGAVTTASADDVAMAIDEAAPWDAPASERAAVLHRVAALYEENHGELFALLATEAGKSLPDAVAELREAVDFLYYYAARAMELEAGARGLFTCISPWNFPLAIFTGQIAAALAAGNGVLAKPAETTPAIAAWGVRLMHAAGVPRSALQLLPGPGRVVGAALTSDPRINGVAFTGSTATARLIQRTMAENLEPGTPLIAETGGLNAMVVDSTALPEQAVRDIVASAFQSAGQRCSALRCLYVQADIAEPICEMLIGAMNELTLGDPWAIYTDVGPVITRDAQTDMANYIARAVADGRLIHQLRTPNEGHFVGPALIAVDGIADLEREIFGPVLHMATFEADEIDAVIAAVNATGYGLTFGLHTRIDDRVQKMADSVHAGNIYANRNQIGAVVGSQPFGGEGLSGTGPKAGGPHYLDRFTRRPATARGDAVTGKVDLADLAETWANLQQQKPAEREVILPGPTGELNRLTLEARPPLLCLGPGLELAEKQATQVRKLGGQAIAVDGALSAQELAILPPFGGLVWWGDTTTAKEYATTLAALDGAIVPLITGMPDTAHVVLERHLCVDTTAAGGNAGLLAGE